MLHCTMRSRRSVGRVSAPKSWGRGFESHLGQAFCTCLCPLRHMRSAQNYPTSASAERATPIPHSLSFNDQMNARQIIFVRFFIPVFSSQIWMESDREYHLPGLTILGLKTWQLFKLTDFEGHFCNLKLALSPHSKRLTTPTKQRAANSLQ